jgi:hypothetical protein
MADREDRVFGAIQLVSADWPIVWYQFPAGRVPDRELQSCLAHLEALMNEAARGREKLFFITDISQMRDMPPAHQRHFTAEWLKRTEGLARMASVGSAHVTPSVLLRGILTAVFWISPPNTPSTFVATREEAMLRGIRLLEAEGARLPPRLVSYRDRRQVSRSI